MARSKKGASNIVQKKPRRRKESAAPKSALADIQKCKELGIETHLQANKTRSSYAGHVRRGREWLASHFDAPSCSANEGDSSVPKEPSVQPVAPSVPSRVGDNPDSDVYADPAFKDAFGCMPNRCSDKALALFMSLKGFHENLSKNTVESIRAAFKKLWEQADGGTFRGKWSFNEARQRWEGNPADSAEVYDVMASVKHKASAEGGDRTHSMAMTKDFMDRMLRWHKATCPLEIVLQAVQLVMSGTLPSQVQLTLEMRTQLTRHLEQVTFDAGAWTLWSRCFELVKLQRKDISLDTILLDTVMKNFIWILLWIKWLEFFHYGHALGPNDFIFPSMGANGIMQPGQPLSHDTVQKWIDKATTGAGILGCFSTHCFRRGGAQYWFMFAPVDGLMVNSDALAPFSREAESSLVGEQALMRPASTEELRMVHASVTADVNHLRVNNINDSLRSLTSMVQAASSCLQAARHVPHLTTPSTDATHMPTAQLEEDPHFTLVSTSSAQAPCISTPRQGHTHITPTARTLPSVAVFARAKAVRTGLGHTASTQQLPTNGLVIPRLPLVRSNGLKTPKAESWKDIITHWLVGDPDRGLKTPLKDWPQGWYQGPNWKLAMQYQNRAVVAHEFINHYQSDEALFLAAYPEAKRGHTPLLAAVNKARAA
ncbi:hypothetical protein EV702DRAFT_1266678 [Suillus placidus]|uniref:Uncharacterized protein n=1 Tax=Suillus placidus TaxID=48579 RepID=A0A9P7A0L3_9AGAM|nr:hypothetical protein EV702DRAFT_1266678 [Suillus placidus]